MKASLQDLIDNPSVLEGKQVRYQRGRFTAGKLMYKQDVKIYFLGIKSDSISLLIPQSLIPEIEITG